MPAPILSKDEVLDRLLDAFRDKGYEGASLAELSAATGLNKSSLYHYFPDGKEEMAVEVLAHLDRQLTVGLYEPLKRAKTPAKKLDALLDGISAFYENGRKACLLERLCTSADRARFRRPLQRAFRLWMEAVEAICLEAGLPKKVARARAEDFVVRVEGSLVVCAGTDDVSVFARTIKDLQSSVLAPHTATASR
jgi:AcrR family transcriptional regulator